MMTLKKKTLMALIPILLLIIVGYQFKTVVENPPVTEDFVEAPDEVREILKNSCYDCHSNETELSFYNKLPIVTEIVKKDIEEARSRINFSEWDKYSEKDKKTILYNILTKIKQNIMPPQRYLYMHSEAEISKKDLETIEAYINNLDANDGHNNKGEDKVKYKKSYNSWIESKGKRRQIKDAPNGIQFPEDYKNWQVISSSFRKDHNSLRVILGNDIAIKAINESSINPWPDGAILGKVVWAQRSDENWEAAVVPSSFIHAEFMFKDSKKYKSTEGWGWARWVGQELIPYGEDSGFSQSCIECHLPVKNKDYVFTTPSIFP
jgi:hypothetical protein